MTCDMFVVLRMWDVNNKAEVKKLEFSSSPSSMELSKDGNTLLITHGHWVTFWDISTLVSLVNESVTNLS